MGRTRHIKISFMDVETNEQLHFDAVIENAYSCAISRTIHDGFVHLVQRLEQTEFDFAKTISKMNDEAKAQNLPVKEIKKNGAGFDA